MKWINERLAVHLIALNKAEGLLQNLRISKGHMPQETLR